MTHANVDRLTSPEALLIEHDTRDGIIARRNVLFGLWTAARLGLTGPDAETYAWSVHFADLDEPGHDDVLAKVAADLGQHGCAVCERSLRRQLREMEARAELQLAAEPL
ncbi:hypothetical protein MPPM_5445 (plasmid) [Methylorubrum populi]|uniref:DUF1476 domain-containing protein n=1 Tax=Methylorubrum populi TaxID=223967 RepID=A0A160PPE4_9HYPH|nr:ATPase inhibitor subunit zeta [Methylorubrum populi]OAH18527.1 hypothetical protein AX289_31500 [Methylorubrum populi]BAU94050.1 hypothetical protein MPPM_5445 [Methylorubrum populi]